MLTQRHTFATPRCLMLMFATCLQHGITSSCNHETHITAMSDWQLVSLMRTQVQIPRELPRTTANEMLSVSLTYSLYVLSLRNRCNTDSQLSSGLVSANDYNSTAYTHSKTTTRVASPYSSLACCNRKFSFSLQYFKVPTVLPALYILA